MNQVVSSRRDLPARTHLSIQPVRGENVKMFRWDLNGFLNVRSIGSTG